MSKMKKNTNIHKRAYYFSTKGPHGIHVISYKVAVKRGAPKHDPHPLLQTHSYFHESSKLPFNTQCNFSTHLCVPTEDAGYIMGCRL